MPNKQSIYNYIEKLREVVARLLRFRKYSIEEFEKQEELQWALDQGMQIAVQCCIDIGEEVITGLNLKKPTAYRETFAILQEHGVISSAVASKLIEFVQYRNELAHEYWRIDWQKNCHILHSELAVFEDYLKAIGALLKQQEQEYGKSNM